MSRLAGDQAHRHTTEAEEPHGSADQSGGTPERSQYLRFGAMFATSTVVMFGFMWGMHRNTRIKSRSSPASSR